MTAAKRNIHPELAHLITRKRGLVSRAASHHERHLAGGCVLLQVVADDDAWTRDQLSKSRMQAQEAGNVVIYARGRAVDDLLGGGSHDLIHVAYRYIYIGHGRNYSNNILRMHAVLIRKNGIKIPAHSVEGFDPLAGF